MGEERSLQQLITTLAEQTNLAIEEESTGIWDALHSHNHDVSLENHGAHLFSVQAQSMTQPGLLQTTMKSARKINLNTKALATHTSPSGTRNLTENSITMQTTYHPEVMQSMQSQNYANEFGQLTDLPKSSFPLKRITFLDSETINQDIHRSAHHQSVFCPGKRDFVNRACSVICGPYWPLIARVI